MKLYLVRHGIALDRLSDRVKTDAERPLTPEGKQEATHVAEGLKTAGIKLDLLVTSPLVRARQTADVFADVFKLAGKKLICEALAPGGTPRDLYKLLRNSKADSVALFGHEPDMSELACALLKADFNIAFKKAGVCRIDVSEMPPLTPAELRWFMPPKLSSQLGRKEKN
jgi:phosphohistidine phosphatase